MISNNIKLSLETPFLKTTLISLVILLALVPLIYEIVRHSFKASETLMKELYLRYFTWLVLTVILILPLLAGKTTAIILCLLLAMVSFFEYSKVSGLSSNKLLCVILFTCPVLSFVFVFKQWLQAFSIFVILSIILLVFEWLRYKRSSSKLNTFQHSTIVNYLCAVSFAYFALFSYYSNFASLMLMILICVEFNDVFAYICGKLFGKRKLCPQISPKKTVAGFAGALIITSALFYTLGRFVFADSPLNSGVHLITMGLLCSFLGQLGDLLLSWIKRDLEIKDFSKSLPGHGGFLDRFDSLVLVSPVLFHYIYFFDSNRLTTTFELFST